MSDTTAYAPFDISYVTSKPYLTVAEYKHAPTAIDTANLLPNTSQMGQDVALFETIGRASSLIDSWCMGAWGTLSATVNVENGRVWGNNKAQLIVHPKYWPIMEVRAFTYGFTPGMAASITPAGSCWIEPAQFIIQATGVAGLGLGAPTGIGTAEYQCTWEYVNGWPNTVLSASVAAGATSVELEDVTAVYPGSHLTVYDLPTDEPLRVDTSYTPGSTTVPLATPTVYQHDTGVRVTNLPPAVKQAAISLVTCLVKIRGSGALIADDIGEVTRQADTATLPQNATSDLTMAVKAVHALRAPFVGY